MRSWVCGNARANNDDRLSHIASPIGANLLTVLRVLSLWVVAAAVRCNPRLKTLVRQRPLCAGHRTRLARYHPQPRLPRYP